MLNDVVCGARPGSPVIVYRNAKIELAVTVQDLGRIQSPFDEGRWPELRYDDNGRRIADDPLHAENNLRLETLDIDLHHVEAPPRKEFVGWDHRHDEVVSVVGRAGANPRVARIHGWRRHRKQTSLVTESGVVNPSADTVRPQIGLQQVVNDRVGFDRVNLDIAGETVCK